MSWITIESDFDLSTYLQALEAESYPMVSLGTELSEPVKLETTKEESCSNVSTTVTLGSSRYGMTSAHLTGRNGPEQLTFWPEDSPAKTSQQEPLCTELKELEESAADFGRSIRGLLGRCGLILSGPKTPLYCEREGLTSSSVTLPSWGMMRDGASLELGTLERHIDGIDFGFWATPNARDYKDYPSGKKTRKDGKRRVDQTPRQVYAAQDGSGLFMPPTAPTTWGEVSLTTTLPARGALATTPSADALGQQWIPSTITKSGTELNTQGPAQIGLQNVEFSEWLMGWPIGWTDLSPLEMGKCPNARLWRSGF